MNTFQHSSMHRYRLTAIKDNMEWRSIVGFILVRDDRLKVV